MTPSPPTVGLIANPLSSKDIRRLVGLARVVDVEEKANLIARLLVGMTAGPAVEVLALDDSAGLVRRAVGLAGTHAPLVTFLDLEAEGSEADTRRAAQALYEAGARLLVTVGGDGTIRSAVEGWPDAVLVPVSAGTNNAVAIPDEPTIIGRAAALAGAGEVPTSAFTRLTALTVDTGEPAPSTALIDVVGVHTRWTGARALWEPDEFVEAVVANPRPTAVGIASIAAALGPLAPGHARHVRFGAGRDLRVILGPGLVADVSVAEHRDVPEGDQMALDSETRVVALDGERRLIRSGNALVDIVAGPTLLSVHGALGDTTST
jgi:hypothetical protein